jgi:hypothetical protein
MMSDNDFVIRGNVLEILAEEGWVGNSRKLIEQLPAATPTLDAAAMQRMAAEATVGSSFDGKPLGIPEPWKSAILALPLPTPEARLAEALRLPEVAALVEATTAARIVLAEHEPHPLPVLGKLLTALRALTGEARHE